MFLPLLIYQSWTINQLSTSDVKVRVIRIQIYSDMPSDKIDSDISRAHQVEISGGQGVWTNFGWDQLEV